MDKIVLSGGTVYTTLKILGIIISVRSLDDSCSETSFLDLGAWLFTYSIISIVYELAAWSAYKTCCTDDDDWSQTFEGFIACLCLCPYAIFSLIWHVLGCIILFGFAMPCLKQNLALWVVSLLNLAILWLIIIVLWLWCMLQGVKCEGPSCIDLCDCCSQQPLQGPARLVVQQAEPQINHVPAPAPAPVPAPAQPIVIHPSPAMTTVNIRQAQQLLEQYQDKCAICLEPFQNTDDIDAPPEITRITHCNHIFHQGCIEQWLLSGGGHDKCPNCKQNVY